MDRASLLRHCALRTVEPSDTSRRLAHCTQHGDFLKIAGAFTATDDEAVCKSPSHRRFLPCTRKVAPEVLQLSHPRTDRAAFLTTHYDGTHWIRMRT